MGRVQGVPSSLTIGNSCTTYTLATPGRPERVKPPQPARRVAPAMWVTVTRVAGRGVSGGPAAGEDVTWPDDLDLRLVPEPARAAGHSGDLDDAVLQQALLGVVRAAADRSA